MTAPNPIPTQLNIAPRGQSWKDWKLVNDPVGFPTREAMEKFHCHPERVQALEEERLALLESTHRLNQLNDRQAAQIKELEAQLEAIGAGGVEPLRKQTQLAAARQGVQPVATRYRFILNGLPDKWEVGCVEMMDNPEFLDAQNRGKFEMRPLYTHPTQQGLDAATLDALQEAESVLNSINMGKQHRVVQADGEVTYWQREEWCKWAAGEVLPKVTAALAAQAKKGDV